MTNLYLNEVLNKQEKGVELARQKCIQQYGNDVLQLGHAIYNESFEGFLCPAYFDKLLCWPPTQTGHLAVQSCPHYIAGVDPGQNATRLCENNGWLMRGNESWTNYTSCYNNSHTTIYMPLNKTHIPQLLQEYAPVVQIVSETGYIVSFITLIIAFAIMLFIKKLHCARNILHMHLFASFIFRAFTFLLIKVTFVEGLGLPSDITYQNGSIYFDVNTETNNWTCKLMTSLWQYFITANYTWILMEGIYLHNLIFRALFANSSNSIKWYVIMGWGLPTIIIGFWVSARVFVEDNLCWTTHENYQVFLIIGIPTMASILLNLLLFVRISLVLYSKLRSPINEDSQRYQKWVKSTLVLVPLFGVHYALFLSLYYLIKTNKVVEVVWLFCDLLFGSFQGFFVAILYCFLNGEVKSEILPHLYKFLTFLATSKCSKYCFPYRKKFLRSVVGRASVCTTMSCSSLYTNGVFHRNSKCKLDSFPKAKPTDKKKDQFCFSTSRKDSKQKQLQPLNFNGPVLTAETCLSLERPKEEELLRNVHDF